jgi:proline iminopeptidase
MVTSLLKKLIFFFVILIVSEVSAHSQSEGYATGKGVKIYYRSFGQGPPVLIINGGPGMNSDGFVGVAQKLSKNNRTIIYDQRGTGRSTLTKTDTSTITMKLMAADIEALRNQLHIKSWIILGHSFGGMLASYYASLYPENCKALILSSSGGIDLGLLSYVGSSINARLTAEQQDSVAYWTRKISEGDTSYHARLQRGRFLAPAYVYDPKNIPAIAERLTQGNSRVNDLVWRDLQKIKFDCTGPLSSFSKPVLIIQGKEDIVSEATAEKAHRVFKNSSLVLLDHCVHYGWLDQEVVYISSVENFIQRN